jgi:hypothetical protein
MALKLMVKGLWQTTFKKGTPMESPFTFFRFSKYEKSSSLPYLGSLNLHQRMLPLCVLLIVFAYLCLWSNASSMLLSTEPYESCIIRKPYSTFPLCLDTFGPKRDFS